MPQDLLSAPSVILAILAVAIVARAAYEPIAGSGRNGILGRVLCLLTDPIVRPVRATAPRIVPTGMIYLFALCWLLAARMLWFVVSAALGLWAGAGT